MKNHETPIDSSIPLSIIISNNDSNSDNNSLNNSLNNEDYNSLLSKNNNNNNDNLQDINIDYINNINKDNIDSIDNIDNINNEKEINKIKNNNKVPTFAYIILVIALFAMSSSGTALKSLKVPPLLKASWRLQSTSVLLFFGFVYEIIIIYDFHIKFIQNIPPHIINKLPQFIKYKINKLNSFNQLNSNNSSNNINSNNNNNQEEFEELKEVEEVEEVDVNNNSNNNNNSDNNKSNSSFNKEEIKLKLFQRNTILLLISTGFILCLHFAFWVSSLDQTTLSHSLLFVTSSPLMVVIVMFVRRIPISKGEVIGCVLGFVGLIVTLFDSLFLNDNNDDTSIGIDSNSNSGNTSKDQGPTFYGDILALLGAVCVVFYLFAGSHLRKWMPIFCYAFIVTFTASIFLSIGSLIFEDRQANGLIGWFSSSFILIILYIAFAPGFLGHTGMNYIILYIEPVVISVTLLLEPPIGTILGYLFGVAGELPSLYTYLGGILILGGCCICTISSHLKNKK